MTDTTTRPQREKLARPSDRWKNWYKALTGYIGVSAHTGTHHFRRAGEVFSGPRTWPSKDIAEQKALNLSRGETTAIGRGVCKYIGAFPE